MKVLSDKDMKRIPVLTSEELMELGRVMYHQKEDELAEKRFWKEVYKKRGLKYNSDKNLVNEFDNLVSSGKLHLKSVNGFEMSNITDEEKIHIMKMISQCENQE